MKICLVCTQGGHLVQMMRLLGAFDGHDYFFVTYNSEVTNNLESAYLIKFEGWDLKGKILLIKYIIKAFRILIKEKPDVIVSTGGGEIAVPFCYIGKVLGGTVPPRGVGTVLVAACPMLLLTNTVSGRRLFHKQSPEFLHRMPHCYDYSGTRRVH